MLKTENAFNLLCQLKGDHHRLIIGPATLFKAIIIHVVFGDYWNKKRLLDMPMAILAM